MTGKSKQIQNCVESDIHKIKSHIVEEDSWILIVLPVAANKMTGKSKYIQNPCIKLGINNTVCGTVEEDSSILVVVLVAANRMTDLHSGLNWVWCWLTHWWQTKLRSRTCERFCLGIRLADCWRRFLQSTQAREGCNRSKRVNIARRSPEFSRNPSSTSTEGRSWKSWFYKRD